MEELPEELLFMVFGYLQTGDVLAVSCVNRRFHRAASDLRLHRLVSFKHSWDVPGKRICKYIKTFKSSIESLNLEDCYWIKASHLKEALLTCKNLRCLNIFGCDVSGNTLLKLLKCNVDLTEIRWSFRHSTKEQMRVDTLEFEKHAQHLKSLHLRVNSYSIKWRQLLFEALEKTLQEVCLWNCPRMGINNCNCSSKFYFQKTPGQEAHTRSSVVDNSWGNHWVDLSSFRVRACDSEQQFLVNYSVQDQDMLDDVASLVNLNNLQSLHIEENRWVKPFFLKVIAMRCSNLGSLSLRACQNCLAPLDGMLKLIHECQKSHKLRHLNLSSIHCHEDDNLELLLMALLGLQGLSSLALSTCTALAIEKKLNRDQGVSIHVSNTHATNEQCLSTGVPDASTHDLSHQMQSEGPFLQMLTRSCPTVKEFELISADFNPLACHGFVPEKPKEKKKCPVLSVGPLVYIANWKTLQKLTLAGLNAKGSANYLTAVMQGCPALEQLSLAYLSQLGHSGGVACLNSALRHSQNLKEFRLEQPHFNISEQFLSSLGNAKKLERLCVIARDGRFAPAAAVLLFEQCPRLFCFQAMCDVTRATINQFTKAIRSRYQVTRPALSVWLEPCHRNRPVRVLPERVPWVHLQDVTLFQSRVATTCY